MPPPACAPGGARRRGPAGPRAQPARRRARAVRGGTREGAAINGLRSRTTTGQAAGGLTVAHGGADLPLDSERVTARRAKRLGTTTPARRPLVQVWARGSGVAGAAAGRFSSFIHKLWAACAPALWTTSPDLWTKPMPRAGASGQMMHGEERAASTCRAAQHALKVGRPDDAAEHGEESDAGGDSDSQALAALGAGAAMTARWPRVFMRTRKPWVRARRVLEPW